MWLAQEADQRVQGTVKEVVAQRFQREAPHLGPLPAVRFDTSYLESRWASLEGHISVYDHQGQLLAQHPQRPAAAGWSTVPEHHQRLCREALQVQRVELGGLLEKTSISGGRKKPKQPVEPEPLIRDLETGDKVVTEDSPELGQIDLPEEYEPRAF